MSTIKLIIIRTCYATVLLFALIALFPNPEPLERQPSAASISQLILEIPPKYGISPMIFESMIEQESRGKLRAIKSEYDKPKQRRRAERYSSDKAEVKMLASSHGPAQVMGYNAAARGLDWRELYKPAVNIEVASAILGSCLLKHKGKKPYQKLRQALICYNGSSAYADEVIKERIIPRVLARLD